MPSYMFKNLTFASCFKENMRNVVLILIVAVTLASCSEYQQVLKSTNNDLKLAMIDTLIKKEKYSKAITLFEQVITQYRGTDKAPELAIKYGDALFNDGLYPTAAGQFERYADAYAFADKVEYARFMEGKSYARMVAVYSRDQRHANQALTKLQDYINSYPDGQFAKEANNEVDELRKVLDKKAYQIAKNYHHRKAYIPAIATFENFITEHPGSELQDDAHYYLLESEFEYAINSIDTRVGERMDLAKKYYDTFATRFPNSEYKKEADKIMKKITEFNNNTK